MTVSIIVPVYNVQNELARCIESLINQTYDDVEIILVDDGSTDHSPEICDEYVRRDPRVKVIHKTNGGLSDARNIGRRASSGEYILYIDSDDWIESDACSRLLSVALSTGADVVVGEAVRETGTQIELMGHSNLEHGKKYPSKEFVSLCISAREWYAPAQFNLYSRSMYEKAAKAGDELFFKRGILHEDMEMLPRLFRSVDSVAFCSGAFYHYIERAGSIMTSNWTEKRLADVCSIYSEWKCAFEAVSDITLRKLLLGYLCKCYLTTCRLSNCMDGLSVEGINWLYLYRYGLDVKEKIKAVLFGVSGRLFMTIGSRFS